MKTLKVSVIVPCYNQAQYLDEALESVLCQTYENWECIIINDGSSDNTKFIAEQWCKKDSRFEYLSQENKGLSSARNTGINHANGEYILPLDADDKISSNYISLAVQSFEQDSSLKIVYCKAEKFGIVKEIWQLPPFSIYDLLRFNMIFCSAIFKKQDWKLAGGYDINLIYGLEDWEFWIAILKKGGNVKQLESVGFYYRIREKSMARIINQEERIFSEQYVLKKHFDFFMATYDYLNKRKKNTEYILQSKKVVINLFTNMFFRFRIFKNTDNSFLK